MNSDNENSSLRVFRPTISRLGVPVIRHLRAWTPRLHTSISIPILKPKVKGPNRRGKTASGGRRRKTKRRFK